MFSVLVLLLLLAYTTPEPFLFMDLKDTHQPWGVLVPTASTLAPNAPFASPQLSYETGSLVIAVLPSLSDPATFEVYCSNTTGNEPLDGAHPCSGWMTKKECKVKGTGCDWQNNHCATKEYPGLYNTLLRYTTIDFVHYSVPKVVLNLANETKLGTPLLKCIARDDQTGLYAMMINDRLSSFISSDEGLSWEKRSTTGLNPTIDKDDLNLIFNNGRFVDMQIAWQNISMRYCDGGGCNRRRVANGVPMRH